MRRWLVGGILLVMVLVGCGGDKDKKEATGGNGGGPVSYTGVTATVTPLPPAPRAKTLPSGDPNLFEAPFSVGQYVRQSIKGKPTAPAAGGQRATYRAGDTVAALTVYRFDEADQALAAVRTALTGSTIVQQVDKPFYGPAAAFGVAQDRFGGYVVAWSQYEWYFQVRMLGSLTDLNAFLEMFPY